MRMTTLSSGLITTQALTSGVAFAPGLRHQRDVETEGEAAAVELTRNAR
jgi:hypothetical protein